jgi:hypothetical protein
MLPASGEQTGRDKDQIEEENRGTLLKPANTGKKYVPEDDYHDKLDGNEGQQKYAGAVGKFRGPIEKPLNPFFHRQWFSFALSLFGL